MREQTLLQKAKQNPVLDAAARVAAWPVLAAQYRQAQRQAAAPEPMTPGMSGFEASGAALQDSGALWWPPAPASPWRIWTASGGSTVSA